ncbi:DnaT-like ssDNA-binding protein [Comamonas koreensis]|uniref:DnaT-like ssDNA-binding protein n=1 Tax=Comamonas koreensis TaxID=160825 RepID=UPI0015F8C7ED|nr:DnaT-like ssDNA-binding protein [Comamonas koreensis]
MLVVAPQDGYESLVSLAEAQDYMERMGYDWPAEVPQQEIALRRGTQYVVTMYSIRPEFLDPVADALKHATCEAALRAADGSLFSDVDAQAVTEESVGPITTKYAQPAKGGQKRFGVIDALMRGMTTGGVGQVKLVRA